MKRFIRNMTTLKIINLIFLVVINLTVEAAIVESSICNSTNAFYGCLDLEFSNEYELVYFYSHSCSHCRTFTPVLVKYAKDNRLNIAGFLLDENVSPINRQATDLSGSINADQEIIEKFFGRIDAVIAPALFLINKKTLHAYPVSRRALTYQELDARIRKLKSQVTKERS